MRVKHNERYETVLVALKKDWTNPDYDRRRRYGANSLESIPAGTKGCAVYSRRDFFNGESDDRLYFSGVQFFIEGRMLDAPIREAALEEIDAGNVLELAIAHNSKTILDARHLLQHMVDTKVIDLGQVDTTIISYYASVE